MPDKKEARVGKWRVVISPSMKYGYFEHDDEGEGGGLWFQGRELVDQDGLPCLPNDAAKAIRKLGYKVDADYLCDPTPKKAGKNPPDEWDTPERSRQHRAAAEEEGDTAEAAVWKARERVTIVTGEKIRTFGGWYRHDKVMLGDREIGRIQTRRRNKRTDTITLGPDPSGSPNGGAVLGRDIGWLLRIAGEKA